ncbi:MAG: sigma-70 family RNA polymerase sigma factor [Phycisphaerae bacterium]|nr:sigma-70 family RNA polymerase sigma factor [Phycisphaerae bacterium]
MSDELITRTLMAASRGEPRAADELLPLVYDELRRLAHARLARAPRGTTLQPTALVHEAYLRLVGDRDPGWNGRAHFFAAAARAMRNILVDRARRKASVKHGGGRRRVAMDDADLPIELPNEDVLALDEALTRLEAADPRKARIVMLHYFGGLTLEETAEALDTSPRTVEREWRFTRAFLFTQLAGQQA